MTTNTTQQPTYEPLEVTLTLPGRLVADYRKLVEAGIYLSFDDAVRDGLVTSWRFMRGTYHNLRLDVGEDEPKPSGEGTQDSKPAAES